MYFYLALIRVLIDKFINRDEYQIVKLIFFCTSTSMEHINTIVINVEEKINA